MATSAESSSKNRNIIIAVVIALLVIGNGVLFYFIISNKKQIEQQNETITAKTDELRLTTLRLDSLNKELQLKIQQVQALGGDTTQLSELRNQLLNDLKIARGAGAGDRRKIKTLTGKVADYVAMLKQRDGEIAKLKEERDAFYADNKALKENIARSEDSMSRLSQERSKLNEQVAIASVLRAENIAVTGVDKKGKERSESAYRARKLDKVKVSFTLADNKVAKLETKELMLRVIEPGGNTLSDAANGGGSFTVSGAETPYTSKQSFLFDNNKPQLNFVYGKNGVEFTPGSYKVELYCEGAKIGESGFNVK